MDGYRPYLDAPARLMPGSVKLIRVLLYIAAAITVLLAVAVPLVLGATAEVIGQVIWAAWPGVVGFFIARGLHLGGQRRFWLVIVVAGFWLLGALGALGHGNPRGITQLIFPIALLIAVTRRSARDFFKG